MPAREFPLSPSPSPIPAFPCDRQRHTRSLARLASSLYMHLFPASHVNPNRLQTFLQHLLRQLALSSNVVFLALKYLATFSYLQTPSQKQTAVTPLLYLTSTLALADSFLNDLPHQLSLYSYASGLSASRIVCTKTNICDALEWHLMVPSRIFGVWIDWLKDFARWNNCSSRKRAHTRATGCVRDPPMSHSKTMEMHVRRYILQALSDAALRDTAIPLDLHLHNLDSLRAAGLPA